MPVSIVPWRIAYQLNKEAMPVKALERIMPAARLEFRADDAPRIREVVPLPVSAIG